MITLRNVQSADLDQLLFIENEGFSKEEAATKEAFVKRIQLIAGYFYRGGKGRENTWLY